MVMLLLAGAGLGRDVHDAVGVDIESDLDPGAPRRVVRCRPKMEAARGLVGCGHFTLALEDVDLTEVWLSAAVEDLALLHRDGGVTVDQLSADAHMVSMPRDRGVTSSSSRPFTSPVKHAALQGCARQPTHSSG